MYERYERPAAGRARNARSSRSGNRRGTEDSRGQGLFLQLAVCLVLFLVVFIGKGVFPSGIMQVRDDILNLLGQNTDFREAFSELGESLRGEDGLLQQLEDFCVEVFGSGEPISEPETGSGSAGPVSEPATVTWDPEKSQLKQELSFLLSAPDAREAGEHFRKGFLFPEKKAAPEPVPAEPGPNPQELAAQAMADAQPEPEAVAAGTVLEYSDYSGDPLPANYTMDKVSLGDLETMTPVLGRINSDYGYRDHPINGRYQFHGGLDIGGQAGDPIHAFADGTVEYIGEDDSYGKYLQIDHGNGVKSFYAHCSKILVQKGQTVQIGDTVAEVGMTGSATGPHLHLELKYGKTHLNPIYYVEYLNNR